MQDRDARVRDPSTISHPTVTTGISTLQKQDGQRAVFVERGVGSPRVARTTHASLCNGDAMRADSDAEVSSYISAQSILIHVVSYSLIFVCENICIMRKAMPAAVGAVAAAAVADQMHEPKEHRNLAIVLVSLILLNSLVYEIFTKNTQLICKDDTQHKGD